MVAFIATCLPEHRRLPHQIRDEIQEIDGAFSWKNGTA
jgi:hypothetical protein